MSHRRNLAALVGLAGAATMLVATASPAFAASSGGLMVYADTVTNVGCLQTNVFHRGVDVVVWRINVLENGQQDKNATVTVQVKGGQTYKAPYNKQDGFYTAAWHEGLNTPTGTIQWTFSATDGSLSGSFQPQFMVAPSELMIVPATYQVNVNVGNGAKSATVVGKNLKSLPIKASVGLALSSEGKTTFSPMTAGKVTAAIGLEGNINAKGQQIVARTVVLRYNAANKSWIGSMSMQGLKPGLYVMQANAQDTVAPPNAGTGTSLAFQLQ